MRIFALVLTALLLGGCSLFEGGDAQVEFRLINRSEVNPDLPILIHFGTPFSARTLSSSDFSGPGGDVAGPFETVTSGELTIIAELLDQKGDPVTTGTVSLPLRSDWKYGVTISVDTVNLARFCFGCQGSKAYPISPELEFASQDSLFIVWGGNSISNPVHY